MHGGIWYARQHLEGPSEIYLILPRKHKTADRQVRRRQRLYIRIAAVTSAHDSPVSESRKLLRPCSRVGTLGIAQASRDVVEAQKDFSLASLAGIYVVRIGAAGTTISTSPVATS
jgi:hypothetical protein